MEFLRTLVLWFSGAIIVTQGIILSLQLSAYRRHKHPSFMVLAIGTVLGLLYTWLILVPRLYPPMRNSSVELYFVALALGAVQLPVGVLGVAWLFRSYRRLADRGNR
jgi:hypothetical protein